MKKYYKNYKYILIILLTILACTKEADIQFSFDFSLEKTHDEIATINYQEPTFIRVVPERIVTDNVYQFSYQINTGSGYLRYVGGEELMTETLHTCETFELDFEFIGTELGEVEVQFTVTDSEGRKEMVFLNYEVIHNPFHWEANSATSGVVVNQTSPLTLVLDNTGPDESVTYKSKAYFSQGNGVLHNIDDTGASTDLVELNELEDIQEGVHGYNLTLNETGENKIIFEAIDSNGQIKKDSLIYNVDIIDFTYIGSAQNNDIFLGENTNLNFEISEILGTGDVYESRFEFNSGTANITRSFNGSTETIIPGNYYDVSAGAYYWTLTPNLFGPIDMTFYARNASGIEHSVNIVINVNTGEFNFDATSAESFADVNDEVLINFDINENGPSGSPYELTFNSTSNGVFTYNGNQYSAGDIISITNLNFIGYYQGLISGEHTVTFNVINSFSQTESDTINILFSEDAFVFTAVTEDENLNILETTNFNFNIVDSGSGSTYEIYYTVTGSGDGVLSSSGTDLSAGQYYDINAGSFSWEFEAIGTGNLTYIFHVINNSGNEQIAEINLNINDIPDCAFTFTAIPAENSSTVGDGVGINFNVNSTIAGTNYTMIYTTSESGSLAYNGTNYSPGQVIDLGSNPSSFVATYSGSTQGAHDLEFTITCDGGTSVSEAATITFDNIDFNLTSSGDTSLYVNTIEDFNLFLSQTVTDPSITYNVVYSLGAGTVGNGNITDSSAGAVVLGTAYPLNLGSTGFNFEGTSVGLVNIQADVTDSNNVMHSTTIAMNVEDISYTFTAAPQNNTIGSGGSTAINMSIIEDLFSGADYQVKYVVVSGAGAVTNNGTVLNTNTYYDVTTGNFAWTFEASASGTVELLFTAVNTTTNEEQTQTVIITVDSSPACQFAFTAIPAENSSTVGDGVGINFNVNSTIAGTNYTMIYTTSESGSLAYNGTNYSPGQVIDLGSNPSSFVATYLGSTQGAHDLEFTIICDGGTSVSEAATITFDNIDFNLTSSGDTSLYVNTIEDFNLFLSQTVTDPSISYNVVYSLGTGTVGNGNITDSSGGAVVLGTAYSLDLGSTGFNFEGTAVGLVNIQADVTDSNNVMHSTTIAMNVEDISYTLSAASQNNTIGSGGSTAINMSIIEDLFSGADYQVKYVVVSGAGAVTNNGTTLNTNTYYDVTTGNFAWTFEASASGTVELLFTSINTTTNEEQTQTVIITVDSSPACQFSFTAIPAENSSTVGDGVGINFNVNSTIAGTNYTMIYTTSEAGSLAYNGTNYSPGQLIDLGSNPSSFVATYIGSTQGAHDLEFTITCDGGTSESQSASITFDNIDFNLTSSGDTSLYVNTIEDFNLFLSQTVTDPSITYNVVYSLGAGTVGNGNITDSSGGAVVLGTAYSLSLGSTGFNFEGTAVGFVNIQADVTDSNNVMHSTIIAMNVEDISYTFTAAPQNNTIGTGGSTAINMSIVEDLFSGADYQVKYVVVSGAGAVTNNGTTLNTNTYYDVTTGNFAWTFEASASGVVELLFTAVNTTTNEEQTQTITITVDSSPACQFTFTAIPAENSSTVGDGVGINFNVNSTIAGTNYTMIYTTSESGTLAYNGNDYTPGQVIDLGSNPSSFVATYSGSVQGAHDLEFTISCDGGTSESEEFTITFSSVDFSLSTVGDGSLLLNELKDLFTIITQNDTDTSISYDIRFNIISGSTGTGEVYLNNTLVPYGYYNPINLGNTPFEFKGTSVGDVELLVEVLDSNGILHNSTINFVIESITFDFEAIEQDGEITLGEATNIFFDLTETANSGTSYEIKYIITSNVTGNLINAGNNVNPNTYVPIALGSSSWVFESVESGNINILFTVRNTSTLEIESDTVSINVEETDIPDFDISVVAESNSVLVDNCVNVNFLLNEYNVDNTTYSFYFLTNGTSSLNGVFEYNGQTYNQGDIIVYNTNISTGCYYSNEEGNHNIEFVFTNNIPITHTTDTDILFYTPDFNVTFDAETLVQDINIDNDIMIDFTIDPDGEIVNVGSPYDLQFSTNNTGALVYDGNTFNSGQTIQDVGITIAPNGSISFSVNYVAYTYGIHELTFTFNNSYGIEHIYYLTLEIQDYNINLFGWILAESNEYEGSIDGYWTPFNVSSNSDEPISISIEYVTESGCVGNWSISLYDGSTSTLIVPLAISTPYVIDPDFDFYQLRLKSLQQNACGNTPGEVNIIIHITNGFDTIDIPYTYIYTGS